jgi:DNA-binding response OmpR family regulator
MTSDLPAATPHHRRTFILDPVDYTVLVDARLVALTPREFRVFHYLVANVGRIIPSEELFRAVWGDDTHRSPLVVAYIRRLRAKIEPDRAHPVHIITARRQGYTFQP